jgi:hypothetical protein
LKNSGPKYCFRAFLGLLAPLHLSCVLPSSACAEPPAAVKPALHSTTAHQTSIAVERSGAQALVIVDCTKDALTLRFTSSAAPIALRTQDIVADHGTASHAVRWSIAWKAPVSTLQDIKEYEAIGSVPPPCPDVGKYTVSVNVVTNAINAVAGKPIEFTMERQADPRLFVAPLISAKLRTNLFGHRLWPATVPIHLQEQSHSSSIDGVSVSVGELKIPTGELASIQIVPASTDPVALKPGGYADMAMILSVVPPPGVYNTRLTIHTSQLSQDTTVDLTVRVQIFLCWLFITIGVGVALGWVVNVWLSATATLDAAMLDALRAADRIVALAQSQRDPAVQQRLVILAGDLQAKIPASKTVQELQTLVNDANSKVTEIRTHADATVIAFDQALAGARAMFSPNSVPLDSLIAPSLKAAVEDLAAVERLGATGDIEEAERQLQSHNRVLPSKVFNSLRAWLASLKGSLDEFGAWGTATQEPEQSRGALLQKIGIAYSAVDPTAMIQQTNLIALSLRSWMALTAPHEVTRILQAAAAALTAGHRPDLAGAVTVCINDISALRVDDPLLSLNSLSAARRRVEDTLRGAAPGNVNVDARLAEGNFLAAATLIAPPPQLAGGAVAAQSFTMPLPVQRASTSLPADGIPSTPIRLRLSSNLTIDQQSTVKIDWSDAPPSDFEVEVQCTPPGAVLPQVGSSLVITPKLAGFFTLTATVANFEPISASAYVGSVQQTPDFEALSKRESRLKLAMWTITAVLTTGVGFQVFASAWLGTTSDFVSAFLWGFFGQFGLDRLRDLAKPLITKSL